MQTTNGLSPEYFLINILIHTAADKNLQQSQRVDWPDWCGCQFFLFVGAMLITLTFLRRAMSMHLHMLTFWTHRAAHADLGQPGTPGRLTDIR